MKSIKRILFSRYMAAALCILLEFAEVMAVFVLLNRFSSIMVVLGYITEFGVLLYIINNDEIAEFKLPWLIVILLTPIIGAFLYLLFGSTTQIKRDQKKYQAAPEELAPYQQQTPALELLKQRDLDAWLQANYIYESSAMPCRTHSKATYCRLGEDFWVGLMDALKGAEHFILMEYFIIEDGTMWRGIHEVLKSKAASGVSVYLMYDDFGCMTTLPSSYYKSLIDEGIHCIPSNKFSPLLSPIHNHRDHRKITVIDGVVGFTGGINLADEYINAIEKHGHWKDTAVKIEGEAVKNLTMLFLTTWNAQSKMPLDYAQHIDVAASASDDDSFIIPFGDSPKPLGSHSVGKHVYLNMINAAKEYLYITTPYLICDYEVINALRLAAEKGVDVRIITPHIPDKKWILLLTRSNYEPLLRAGVKIYEYTPGFIHAKGFVCDDKFAVCGTINLDYRSLAHHFECGAWIYNSSCVADMKSDFVNTMNQSQSIAPGKVPINKWFIIPLNVLKVFSPMF